MRYFFSAALIVFFFVFAGFPALAAGAAAVGDAAFLARVLGAGAAAAAGAAAFFARGLAAGLAAAAAGAAAFLARGFAAGLAAGAAAFFARGLAAGFSRPATSRLGPPLTPRVFSNRVTAAFADPISRESEFRSLCLRRVVCRNSLYCFCAALTVFLFVLAGPADLAGPAAAAVAFVARVGLLAAVAGRALRTVPVEANRPRASRFNCLAMLTLMILV